MCWGGQQFKQTYTCTYLPTGEGDCLVTIDVWLPSVGVREAWSEVNTHMATADHYRQGQAGCSQTILSNHAQ